VAFAPAEQPRIAIAVLVENVGFGAENAAPIARAVMDAYLLGSDGKLKPEFEPSAPARARLDTAPAAASDAPGTVSQ
jgi:penicillin-binding protein 2